MGDRMALRCKECRTEYPLEARYVCEHCFGPLEVAYDYATSTSPRCGAGSRPARRTCGATPTSCRSTRRRRRLARAGHDPAASRADRLAERLGARRGLGQERRRQPDALVQGPRRVGRAGQGARELGFETRGLRLDRQPGQRVAAHAAAAGLESYVFIPADLEEQKILATGDLRRERGRPSRQLRRRQPALHGDRRRARLGLRQRQPAARTTPRARRRSASRSPSSSAASCPTTSSRRWPRARCSPRSRRGFGEWLELGLLERRPAGVQRRPGRGLLAGRDRPRGRAATSASRCKPGHDRQVAGDRQPGRRALRARPRPQHRRRRSTR